MLRAFLWPALPVQALELPELTTTARMSLLFMCCFETATGAPKTLFVVKTAAAFAPAGQFSRARSNLPEAFIPQARPAAEKPFGAVIVLFAIVILP